MAQMRSLERFPEWKKEQMNKEMRTSSLEEGDWLAQDRVSSYHQSWN